MEMKRRVGIALGLISVGLLVAVFLLSDFSMGMYRKYNALRMDPLGLGLKEEVTEGDYDFLLLGDSLIARWRIPGYAVLNKGIGAQTSSQVKYRVKLLQDKPIHAKTAIICVGGNDLKSLRLDPDLSDAVVETTLLNIEDIVAGVKSISDEIYLMTIPPIYTVPFYMKPLQSTHITLASLEAINDGIIQMAEDEGIHVLDAERILQGMAVEEVLAKDKVHLSDKAYEKLFEEVSGD